MDNRKIGVQEVADVMGINYTTMMEWIRRGVIGRIPRKQDRGKPWIFGYRELFSAFLAREALSVFRSYDDARDLVQQLRSRLMQPKEGEPSPEDAYIIVRKVGHNTGGEEDDAFFMCYWTSRQVAGEKIMEVADSGDSAVLIPACVFSKRAKEVLKQ